MTSLRHWLLPVVIACSPVAWGQATFPASQPASQPAATRAATPVSPATQPSAGVTFPPYHPAPLPLAMDDFKTTENCKTATIAPGKGQTDMVPQAGYLGIVLDETPGKLTISAIAPDSPAAKAGFKIKDTIVSVDGHFVNSADDFSELIHAITPGTAARIAISRGGLLKDLSAMIAAVSRPMSLTGPADRPTLGVSVREDGTGAHITQVEANSPAARAMLRVGDVILKVDGVPLTDTVRLGDALRDKKTTDDISLLVDHNGVTGTFTLQLAAADGARPNAAGAAAAGQNSTYYDRLGLVFKKDTLRLAVVGIEYPDIKHNPAITNKNWEDSLFSHNTYKLTATGQAAYGSMADYYFADSYGQLRVVGNMLPWVTVSKNRADYSQGSGTGQDRVLLNEAIALVVAKDSHALDLADGVIFVYAGNRVATTRGSIYWPHKSQTTLATRRMPYVIVPEGTNLGGGGPGGRGAGTQPDLTPARQMTDISVICHESGHVLGLPDLYAQPENPGSVGLGPWCLMSQQTGQGRPQFMCAWSKEAMGWLKPTVIDPNVKQKLVLGPVEDSPKECYKVLVKPDGSEYFLLENRVKKSFDANLPGEGLLIWRVIGNRPFLMESHGIDGPGSPSVFTAAVPYPSPSNDSFTPYSTPSSRSPVGGGNQVYISNIKKMTDGRISFWIGYAFQ